MIVNDREVSGVRDIQDVLELVSDIKDKPKYQGDLHFIRRLQMEEIEIRFAFNNVIIISPNLHTDVKIDSQAYIGSQYQIEGTTEFPIKNYKIVPPNVSYIGNVHYSLFGKHYINVLEDASVFARRDSFPRGKPGNIKHIYEMNCRDYSSILINNQNRSLRDFLLFLFKENGGTEGMPNWLQTYYEYEMNLDILS